MIKSHSIFVLLVAFMATSKTFAQKKNSFSYQVGILNHFYDESPVIFHADNIQSVSSIKGVFTDLFISSKGFSYARVLNNKSNISIIGAKFGADYINTTIPLTTNIIKRDWRFLTIEYNRKLIEKNKFQLFYGGGLTYRRGTEVYFIDINAQGVGLVHSGFAKVIGVENLGLTLNANIKYIFWKNFFFYSKLDTQLYFHQFKRAKQSFVSLQERYDAYKFTATKKINHTLTIGIGIDF